MNGAPRVLFVARQPPLPMDNGGRIRVAGLLDGLSRLCPVHLVTFDAQVDTTNRPVSSDAIEARFPLLESVKVVRRPARAKRVRQAASVIFRRPYLGSGYVTKDLANAVRVTAARFPPDVVFVDSLHLGGVISTLDGTHALRALSPQNVESELLREMADSPDQPALVRRYYRAESRQVEVLERKLMRAYDLICAVSEHDAAAFAARDAGNVTVVPNGTWVPQARRPPVIGDPSRLSLLFVGATTYRPNADGVRWFAETVLPRIRRRIDAELTVVGEGSPVARIDGVNWAGHVESIDDYYDRCDALVVPLQSGGGSRLKVVEAFARRVPVVSTSKGVAGIEVEDGRQAWLADDAESLAQACLNLHRDLVTRPAEVDRRVELAFATARRLSWDAIADALLSDFQALLAQRR